MHQKATTDLQSLVVEVEPVIPRERATKHSVNGTSFVIDSAGHAVQATPLQHQLAWQSNATQQVATSAAKVKRLRVHTKSSTEDMKRRMRELAQARLEKQAYALKIMRPLLHNATWLSSPDYSDFPTKNKVVVVVLELTGLGILGIDRFWIGGTFNIVLGILKLLTCGGCGLWALVDFVAICSNAIGLSPYLSCLGMHCQWADTSMMLAQKLGFAGMGLLFLICLCGCCVPYCRGAKFALRRTIRGSTGQEPRRTLGNPRNPRQ